MLSTFFKSTTKTLSTKTFYPVHRSIASRSLSFCLSNGSRQDSFRIRSDALIAQYRGSISMIKRSFSSKELVAALEKQIIDEKKQQEDVDGDFENVKKAIESDFKIIDTPGVTVVELQKQSGQTKLTLSFDCAERDQAMMDDEEGDDENNDDEEPLTGVPFEVTIDKNGSKVLISCFAGDGLEVNNVRYSPAGKDFEKDKLYAGPIFEDLDEDLQKEFAGYLESLGINDDMLFFINAYADRKEQREYENWLKAVQTFLK